MIRVVVVFVVFFMLFFHFSDQLFHQLVLPLLSILQRPHPLIATQVTTSFLVPMQLAADAALLCALPYALFQLGCFVSPGLYLRERRYARWGIVSSLVLFVLGVLVGFYGLLPFMLQFFVAAVPAEVRLMPDLTYAIAFITRVLLTVGLSFQVPLVCPLLILLNWVDVKTLTDLRRYVIVAVFILSMLLTPPDVLSQVSLAVPLCLLYELGLLLARLIETQLQPQRIQDGESAGQSGS